MPDKLEDRCSVCPELLADGYGRCDHRRCMACVERWGRIDLLSAMYQIPLRPEPVTEIIWSEARKDMEPNLAELIWLHLSEDSPLNAR